jgi:hypothetical protein
LPLLLGFAVLLAAIIGAFAKSLWVALGAAFVLSLLAALIYRTTVRMI